MTLKNALPSQKPGGNIFEDSENKRAPHMKIKHYQGIFQVCYWEERQGETIAIYMAKLKTQIMDYS